MGCQVGRKVAQKIECPLWMAPKDLNFLHFYSGLLYVLANNKLKAFQRLLTMDGECKNTLDTSSK